MPAIADITIKKNDGTTDITYAARAPSSGDNVPAVFKSTTVGSAQAHQPELRISSRDGSKGANRVLRGTFSYPQIATDSTTTLTSVVKRATANFELNIPKDMAQADVDEFVSQFFNLGDSSLIVSCGKAGFAPT